MKMNVDKPAMTVTFCAVCLLTAGLALAESNWIDELTNSLTFYQTNYPTSNWEPYIDKVARVRDGNNRGDQHIVDAEMNQFLKMLRTRAYGYSSSATLRCPFHPKITLDRRRRSSLAREASAR
ncbi:MAG: hypothetical protein ACREJU_12330 [Nitrospiraceae bacterium]